MELLAGALVKHSFLLDKGFPYLNSGLVSSRHRLVLCHGVWEGSSSEASLSELPFTPLFQWLDPVAFVFVITARESIRILPLGVVLWALRTSYLHKGKHGHTSQADHRLDVQLVLSIEVQS